MVTKVRKLLVRIGKVLPFIICLLACVNFIEIVFATATRNFLMYDSMVIPNTPISFFIGQYFEYNLQMLLVLCIISIAIQTCIYNKLACLYLGVNLYEKSYFSTIELYPEYIYLICIANILISSFFVYKGIKILTSK